MKFEFYLAYFFLTFPIDPPESIKKRLIFRNDQNTKETLGRNELKWFAESCRAVVYSAQRKITNLHLIPWCGNFVERHSFAQKYVETGSFHKISTSENFVKFWCFT